MKSLQEITEHCLDELMTERMKIEIQHNAITSLVIADGAKDKNLLAQQTQSVFRRDFLDAEIRDAKWILEQIKLGKFEL